VLLAGASVIVLALAVGVVLRMRHDPSPERISPAAATAARTPGVPSPAASTPDPAMLAQTYHGGYPSVLAQFAHLDQVAAQHPTLAAVIDYGQSYLRTPWDQRRDGLNWPHLKTRLATTACHCGTVARALIAADPDVRVGLVEGDRGPQDGQALSRSA
jgi:hypothetical protein